MGKLLDAITPELEQFITAQKLFFVATAPLDPNGHVNCSPKGLDSFRILDPVTIVYQDLTGSGVETIAHVNENKRITILFCAFNGPPFILRLYGNGEVVTSSHSDFESFQNLFPSRIGVRSYIRVHLSRVTTSCGYGVPLFDFKNDRDTMLKWAEHKGEEGVIAYRREKNQNSIDGLPGITDDELSS